MKKILLVDDDEDVRDLVERTLTDAGFEVVSAETGEVCLGLMVQEAPDMLLLDLIMPDMDGFEIMRAVRKSHPEVPVVVLSGYIEKETEEIIEGLGGTSFIRKPFSCNDLVMVVERAFQDG